MSKKNLGLTKLFNPNYKERYDLSIAEERDAFIKQMIDEPATDNPYKKNPMRKIWNKLESYGKQIMCCIGPGGFGKTNDLNIEMIYKSVYDHRDDGKLFVWFVQNDVMVKLICKDKGKGFFARSLLRLRDKKPKVYEYVKDIMIDDKNEEQIKVIGGSVFIQKRHVGYIFPVLQYDKLKGFNADVHTIVFDEFIPEVINFQTKDYIKAFVSVTNTFERNAGCKIYLAANPIRLESDPILKALGANKIKMGETIVNGNMVTHYIDSQSKDVKRYLRWALKSTSNQLAIGSGILYRAIGVPALDVPNIKIVPDLKLRTPLYSLYGYGYTIYFWNTTEGFYCCFGAHNKTCYVLQSNQVKADVTLDENSVMKKVLQHKFTKNLITYSNIDAYEVLQTILTGG